MRYRHPPPNTLLPLKMSKPITNEPSFFFNSFKTLTGRVIDGPKVLASKALQKDRPVDLRPHAVLQLRKEEEEEKKEKGE
jgi:hypothetical protein